MTMQRTGYIAALAAFPLVLAGCTAPEPLEGPGGGSPLGGNGTRDAPATGTFEVAMHDFRFEPREVWLRAGSAIGWPNAGQAVHTATADQGAWDSGDVSPGERFSHTFDEPGDFSYVCIYHEPQGMVGTVHVVP